MTIKIYSVKCPECRAPLPIEEGRMQLFCSYCGAKIVISNENEFVYRHIDEAELTQAKTDRLIELKRLEMEEKRREEEAKRNKLKMIVSIVVGAIGIVCLGFGYANMESGLIMPGFVCLVILAYMWLFDMAKKKREGD